MSRIPPLHATFGYLLDIRKLQVGVSENDRRTSHVNYEVAIKLCFFFQHSRLIKNRHVFSIQHRNMAIDKVRFPVTNGDSP